MILGKITIKIKTLFQFITRVFILISSLCFSSFYKCLHVPGLTLFDLFLFFLYSFRSYMWLQQGHTNQKFLRLTAVGSRTVPFSVQPKTEKPKRQDSNTVVLKYTAEAATYRIEGWKEWSLAGTSSRDFLGFYIRRNGAD